MNEERTATPAGAGPAMNAQGRPPEDQVLLQRMRQIERRIHVLSGKGGVGKSTVAVNLAVALAQRGRRVGLLDVDVHGPSVPTLLHLSGQRIMTDGELLQPIVAAAGLKVISMGLLTASADEAVVWRGPRKNSAIRQLLRDVNWGELDDLVVDCPPGTGDEPLSVVQLAGKPAIGVVVTTPQEVAVADVRRCLTFCQMLDLPVAGIVENMGGVVCPHCGKVFDLFGQGGGGRLAREAGVPFLGSIPLDPAVVRGGDAGQPFALGSPDTAAARAFEAIVGQLLK